MFKRLLDNTQLNVSEKTNLKALGLTAYPTTDKVYYVFNGTATMYYQLPFKNKKTAV